MEKYILVIATVGIILNQLIRRFDGLDKNIKLTFV